MSTRSDIIVERADGKFARIYCHWDGYPEHNGKLLFEHYQDATKAEKLVSFGDLSSLAENIGRKHKFDSSPKGQCTFYGRDRGETGIDASIFNSLSAAWPDSDTGTEFTYAFVDRGDGRGRQWYIGDPDEGSETLRDLGAVLRGDDAAPATAIKAFGGNIVIGHR